MEQEVVCHRGYSCTGGIEVWGKMFPNNEALCGTVQLHLAVSSGTVPCDRS